MTNMTPTLGQSTARPAGQQRAIGGLHLDWIVTLLSAWMIDGIHLDAWVHHQFEVETFFTPWHGVLYSGYLALAAVLVGMFAFNLWQGRTWRRSLPTGYGLSFLGVAIFMAGGVGDMLWHIVFGIEVNIEALLSPTHLMLALGGALIVSGPRPAGKSCCPHCSRWVYCSRFSRSSPPMPIRFLMRYWRRAAARLPMNCSWLKASMSPVS